MIKSGQGWALSEVCGGNGKFQSFNWRSFRSTSVATIFSGLANPRLPAHHPSRLAQKAACTFESR